MYTHTKRAARVCVCLCVCVALVRVPFYFIHLWLIPDRHRYRTFLYY